MPVLFCLRRGLIIVLGARKGAPAAGLTFDWPKVSKSPCDWRTRHPEERSVKHCFTAMQGTGSNHHVPVKEHFFRKEWFV